MYGWLLNSIDQEYAVIRVLKESPRGSVRLIRHKALGKRLILRRFQGSGEVYRQLMGYVCGNLPQIYETAEQDGEVLVLEEFIEGDTLGFLLEEALFSPRETREIVLQLCRALWVLHSMAAVHRDIKPEHVILRGRGTVLIDFDAARMPRDNLEQDTHHRLCRPGAVRPEPVRRAHGHLCPGGAHERDAHRGAPIQEAG